MVRGKAPFIAHDGCLGNHDLVLVIMIRGRICQQDLEFESENNVDVPRPREAMISCGFLFVDWIGKAGNDLAAIEIGFDWDHRLRLLLLSF